MKVHCYFEVTVSDLINPRCGLIVVIFKIFVKDSYETLALPFYRGSNSTPLPFFTSDSSTLSSSSGVHGFATLCLNASVDGSLPKKSFSNSSPPLMAQGARTARFGRAQEELEHLANRQTRKIK